MTSLPPNARAEDIEVEIIFQQTLLEMLDQDADSYNDERYRLEKLLQELGARLEALTGNGYTGGGDESQTSLQDFTSVYLGTSLISIFQHKAPGLNCLLPSLSLHPHPLRNFSSTVC